MATRHRSQRFFWPIFIVLEIVFLAMTILSHNKQNIRILVVLYLFSFLPFFLAFRQGSGGRISAQMIFLTGIVLRLTLLASYPVFSDDIFRYLWEGKMQINGINPYLTAPADAATIPYRDAYFQQINHKTIPTIYPPLSELFFRVCMKTAYNLYFFKAMLILLDLGLLVFLNLIIRKRGIPVYYLLIYAWHPLVIVEMPGKRGKMKTGIEQPGDECSVCCGTIWSWPETRFPAQ